MQILSTQDCRNLFHFIQELGEGDLSLPTFSQLEAMIGVAFWASLETEEGRPVQFSLLFARPWEADSLAPLKFERSLEFTPQRVVKLAPALLRSQRALALAPNRAGKLEIWGTTALPTPGLTLETSGPGSFRIRVRERNRVLLHSGRMTFLTNDNADNLLFLVDAVSQYGFEPTPTFVVLSQALERVLESVLRQGHGGSLLWVPQGRPWRSGVKSIDYECFPPYQDLSQAAHGLFGEQPPEFATVDYRDHPIRQQLSAKLRGIQSNIEAVGQLTAVDGATVINDDLVVLAFGVMLHSHPAESETLVQVLELGGERQPDLSQLSYQELPLAQLGGARHRSAAEFCLAHHESLAFVASQDGSLTIFGWQHHSNRLFAICHAELALL